MTTLSGNVTLSGSAQANVPVLVVDTDNSSDPSNWTIAASDTTDVNGDWSVSGLAGGATERYHAIVQYDDGTQYNALSKPYLSTPGTPIPDSAIHRWPIDEGSGSTIADAIGSNDGTINGATWTSGTWIGDYALSLDGTDNYLSFATVPVIDTSTEFAVSVTVEIPSLSFTGQKNIMHHQTSNSNRFAISADGDNDCINAGLFDGSFIALASGGVSTGQKVRIVYNYDGSGNGELYLNTTEQTGTNNPSTIADETGFEIGRRLDGVNYLQFDVDEPIIYDTQLSSAQVQDDYDRQPWS